MENFVQQNPIINLKSECFVKPKQMIEASNQPYHLGPTDIVMLSIDPIQKGLLFAFPPSSSSSNNNNIVSNLLDKLKTSLSIALVHFYPLAGRFTTQQYPEENSCSVFVDCNKGPGARFIHASNLTLSVSDIIASSDDVTIAHPFFDLGEKYVNFDGHTKALLCIQVTELLDGMFIGFSMNHSVVDGTSATHFVSMLSEIFNSLDLHGSEMVNISRVPIFNYRPWFNSNQDNNNPMLKFPVIDLEDSICRGYDPGPLRARIFHFGPTSLAQLKARANQECGAYDVDVVISSFQALTAFLWRSLTRVRGLPMDQETTCFFAIGARNRFDPPISEDYFGGFISPAKWGCKVEELFGHDLGWVAMRLWELITTTDAKVVLSHFTEIAESPMMIPRGFQTGIHGDNSLIMGGSTRFDMYGFKFGLGRALAVRLGFGNKEDGKITAIPGCERGSVDLEICLRPSVMAAFEADQEFMSFVTTNN